MPLMRRATALSATLALASAAAPLPLANAATSSATFTKKANAACASAGAKVEALPKATDANVAKELRQTAKILTSLAKKLDGITPPSAKATKYKAFVATLRKQVKLADQTAAAVDAKDAKKAKSLASQVEKSGDKSDAQARALKLGDCARTYTPGAGSGTTV